MTSAPHIPVAHRIRKTYTYDAQGRRIREQTYRTLNSAENAHVTERTWIYQGWNPVLEQKDQAPHRAMLWGIDLSATEQGAGGVGGLLAIEWLGGQESTRPDWYYHYDGNGNVSQIYGDDNQPKASYQYTPFGQVLWAEGEAAMENDWRFSTKLQDPDTGFLYYGFRYYNTVTGRWFSRDPIEEEGGVNIYGFVGNDGIKNIELLGLRAMTAGERQVVLELRHEAWKIRNSLGADYHEPLAKAFEAVADDIVSFIASQNGKEDPVWLKLGLVSLAAWADKDTAISYSPEYYTPSKPDTPTCNFFVAEMIGKTGQDISVIHDLGNLLLTKRPPVAGEWGSRSYRQLGDYEVTWIINEESQGRPVKTRKQKIASISMKGNVGGESSGGGAPVGPSMGDVVAFPTEGHVGIYVGRGLYLSSTTQGPTGTQGRALGVILKFVPEGYTQIYRSKSK